MRETTIDLRLGDCREVLRSVPDESLDACVTDPPYGLSKEPDIAEVLRHWLAGESYEHGSKGFMGSAWDSFVPGPEYWREVYRVLKPGAYLLAFCGTRTWDLLSIAIRFAGFENRDTIRFDGPPALGWAYFTGFPKSHAVGKAIDRAAGAERTLVGIKKNNKSDSGAQKYAALGTFLQTAYSPVTAPASPEAEQYEGFGTALKPAWEVILVFRKPLIGTVAANVLAHGTGALNIDGCRVEGTWNRSTPTRDDLRGGAYGAHKGKLIECGPRPPMNRDVGRRISACFVAAKIRICPDVLWRIWISRVARRLQGNPEELPSGVVFLQE